MRIPWHAREIGGGFRLASCLSCEAKAYAQGFWEGMLPLQRVYSLWDIPLGERRNALFAAWSSAAFIGLGFYEDAPAAACWLAPIHPQADAACAHFIFCKEGRRGSELLAREFMIEAEKRFSCLLALMPRAWRGQIRLAKKAGFREAARLPDSCWIDYRKRLADGILLTCNFREREIEDEFV